MAPKMSRMDDGDLALRQQLAELKQVPLEQIGRIRMTAQRMPSLVDVGVILTGKEARNVARDLQSILEKYSDLVLKVNQVSFGGRGGNRDSLVPQDIPTLIEVIFLLPGRAAAQVRSAAAQIFVRYLGGDLSLIGEVQRIRHVQDNIGNADLGHPLRLFEEAVEKNSAEALQMASAYINNPICLDMEGVILAPPPVPSAGTVSRVDASSLASRSKPPTPKRPAVMCDECVLFSDLVKLAEPDLVASQWKLRTFCAYAKFLEIVAEEEHKPMSAVSADLKDSTFGLKAVVPEKWKELAVAAIAHASSPSSSVIAAGDVERPALSPSGTAAKRPRTPFVAEAEHGVAKDAANAMWIQLLRRGSLIFFLDSWKDQAGLKLRTLSALLHAGHLPELLHSANPDVAICNQLRHQGVQVQKGDWAHFHLPQKLDGMYLDLCSGSESYVRVQLELATSRAATNCVLAWTLTERDFNGTPLLLRAMSLSEFLIDLGWTPALQRLSASTLLHRSFVSRLQVITQFWVKK